MRLRLARASNGAGSCALAASVASLLLAATPVHAAEETGCKAFLWPIAKEQVAFAKADLAVVESGAARGPWGEQAFALKLKPAAEAALATPPSGAPHGKIDKPYAGTVTFETPPEPGAYHVTLSQGGWIDVVQGGRALEAAAHTGAQDCPGVRKSVRFELTKAPLVLQISGAGSDTIKIGIVPASD